MARFTLKQYQIWPLFNWRPSLWPIAVHSGHPTIFSRQSPPFNIQPTISQKSQNYGRKSPVRTFWAVLGAPTPVARNRPHLLRTLRRSWQDIRPRLSKHRWQIFHVKNSNCTVDSYFDTSQVTNSSPFKSSTSAQKSAPLSAVTASSRSSVSSVTTV